MRNFSLVALLTLMTSSAHASGGFTWMTQLAKATGLEEQMNRGGLHHYEHIPTFLLVLLVLVFTGFYYRAKTKNVDAAVVRLVFVQFHVLFVYMETCMETIWFLERFLTLHRC